MVHIIEEIKEPFTEVNLDYESGIVLVNEEADPAYVKKIRIWNLIESFTIYGLILLIVWTSMLDTSLWWLWAGLGFILIWTLFLTPLIHYKYEKDLFLTEEQQARGIWFYWFECRGLGSPRRYYFEVDGEEPLLKQNLKPIMILTIFIDILFIALVIDYPAEAEQILGGISGGIIPLPIMAVIFLILLDALLIFLAYPVMLRLDNFRQSYKFMLAFIVIAIPLIFLFNLFFQLVEPLLGPILADNPYMNFRGDPAATRLANFNIISVMGQWSGYIFWGWLQQLLFLSVFNTYFARGFDIREKKQRLYACLCSALFFGLIHIPNFWLSMFTFISGFFWALYFMQCRNLFAMGIVHGFGGTLLNKLAPINFSVGPSQVS